jgi:Holliday junction resolvasome RuvABC endonuclease subunit
MRMAIDPGHGGTGYVIWKMSWQYVTCGIIAPSKSMDWETRGKIIAERMKYIRDFYRIKEIYMEYPAYFSSVGGEMVAKRGDLAKLLWLVGLIHGMVHPTHVELVRVTDWKGQLPKAVVEERLRKLLGKSYPKDCKSHSVDALGIGMYVRGIFK